MRTLVFCLLEDGVHRCVSRAYEGLVEVVRSAYSVSIEQSSASRNQMTSVTIPETAANNSHITNSQPV